MINILLFLALCGIIHAIPYNILSANAYCDNDSTIENRNRELGYVTDTIFSQNMYDVHGYIVHNDYEIVTVLRGTHSVQNWIDDIDVKLIDIDLCSDCKVHEGFYNYAMSVLPIVNETLTQYPNHKHIFTGHSLGSSVMFLALMLYNNETEIYTFGSPRIGNDEFMSYINKKIKVYRYTHYQDTVVHIPSSYRFAHYNKEYYEDEFGNITNKCNEENACSKQFNLYETNVDDHMMYLGHYMGCYVPVPDYMLELMTDFTKI